MGQSSSLAAIAPAALADRPPLAAFLLVLRGGIGGIGGIGGARPGAGAGAGAGAGEGAGARPGAGAGASAGASASAAAAASGGVGPGPPPPPLGGGFRGGGGGGDSAAAPVVVIVVVTRSSVEYFDAATLERRVSLPAAAAAAAAAGPFAPDEVQAFAAGLPASVVLRCARFVPSDGAVIVADDRGFVRTLDALPPAAAAALFSAAGSASSVSSSLQQQQQQQQHPHHSLPRRGAKHAASRGRHLGGAGGGDDGEDARDAPAAVAASVSSPPSSLRGKAAKGVAARAATVGVPSSSSSASAALSAAAAGSSSASAHSAAAAAAAPAVVCLLPVSGTTRVIAGCADGVLRVHERVFGVGRGVVPLHDPSVEPSAAPRSHRGGGIAAAGAGDPVTCLAFDEARRWVFVGRASGALSVVALDHDRPLHRLKGHSAMVHALELVGDFLVSCAKDATLRVWQSDTGRQVTRMVKMGCVSLCYDEWRRVLFCGCSDGSLLLARLRVQPAPPGLSVEIMKRIKKVHGSALTRLWYHSEVDALLFISADHRIGYWPGVTDLPHAHVARSAPQFQDATDAELQRYLDTEDVPPGAEPPVLQEERARLDVCAAALGPEAGEKVASLRQTLGALAESLRSGCAMLDRELALRRARIASLPAQRAELLERHRRELELFDASASQRRRDVAAFKSEQLGKRRQLACDVSAQIRRMLLQNFPVIGGTYLLARPIGNSSVFVAVNLDTFEPLAVKAFPPGVSIDTSLSHETLVPIVDVIRAENGVFVVMMKMKENLAELVDRQPNLGQNPGMVAGIMWNLFRAVSYLHSNRMVARDLRPAHILASFEGRAVVLHLGVMRAMLGTLESETPDRGRIYSAPELFGRAVKGSSDIWSLGCVFLYLLQSPEQRARPLFHGRSPRAVLRSMLRVVGRPTAEDLHEMGQVCKMAQDGLELMAYVGRLRKPTMDGEVAAERHRRAALRSLCAGIDENALDLLCRMLHFAPQRRISAVEALHHAFFAQFGLRPTDSDLELAPHTDLTGSAQSEESADEKGGGGSSSSSSSSSSSGDDDASVSDEGGADGPGHGSGGDSRAT